MHYATLNFQQKSLLKSEFVRDPLDVVHSSTLYPHQLAIISPISESIPKCSSV